MEKNSIEDLRQRLQELYQTQQARLDVGADDLDIREEIAEVEDEIKESEDDINEENNNGNDTNVGSIEDSIEKDIDILNNIKEYMQENIDNGYHKFCYNEQNDEKCVDIINAIDHILSDYKRVLKINKVLVKENEELKERIREHTLLISPYYVKENFIPVQKVKDKIEEIKERKMDIVMSLVHNRDEKIEILKKDKIRIQILQELLESEETNDKNNKKG